MFRATGAIVFFLMIFFTTFTSFNRVYAQQTRTWVGGTGIWETASNWNPPGVPTVSDTAVIVTGVVTMTSNQTIGGFRLNGKFISDATLTVTGKMQWFRSTQEGSGSTVISSGAVLEITGSDFKELIGHTLDNQGTVIWKDDGFIKLHNQAQIFNRAGATFEIQNDELMDFILPDSGGTFYNYGTLIKSGGSGTTIMDALFYNSGSIVVNSGELRFERGSDTPSSGTMNTATGGEIEFAKTPFRLDGVTFGGSGLVQISDGSLEISGSGITVQNGVRMAISDSDGYLQGDGPITVNGIFDFAHGKVFGNGSFTVSGTMELTGSSTRTLVGRTITNNGSIINTGTGTLRMQDNAQIINTAGAIFDLQSDANIDYLDPSGGKIFNYGNFQKSAGSGTTLIDVELINEGSITVNSGTVKLTRGGNVTACSNTIAAGSRLVLDDEDFLLSNVTFGGSGTVEFSTNSVTVSSGGVTILSPATLEFPGGTVKGSGDLTIEGTFDWSRGALSGSGDVIVNGLLKITGSNYKELIERTLINNTTTIWSDGDIKLKDQAKIINQSGSLFDVKTDNLMDYVLADNGGSFVNLGQLKKTAGSGTATIDPIFHNTGTVEVLSGTLRFERGSASSSSTGHFLTHSGTTLVLSERTFIIDGAYFEGAGITQVTDAILEVTGTGLQMSADATIKLDDPDGKIQGTGPLTIDGRLEWLQGTINGSGNFVINNTLVLGGSHFKELTGRTITNNGTTIATGSGSLRFSNSAVFDNTSGAVFEFQADAPFVKVLPDGGTFNNHGILRKLNGSGDSQLGIDLVNYGAIEVQGGATLSIASGGRLLFPQGTVTGAGILNIQGSMLWSGGTVAGNGQLTNHGLIELSGSGLKTLDTRTLVNYDSLRWLGSGNFGLKNNALIDTRAGSKFFIESSGTLSFLTPNGGSLSNGGTLLRPNSGTAHFGVDVSNSGTVEALNGTLDFNAAFNNLAGANLKGRGVLDFSDAIFSNNGNTSPGSPLGKLSFQGNYQQGSGSALNIEIGGHLPGVNYDKLVVSGTADLGGQLNIELENLYVPAIGDTFRVLSYGARNGQFDDIIMPVVSGQPAFALSYLNDGLILTAVAENLPPVAVNDVAATPEDVPVSVNVLLNDAAQNTGSIFLNSFTQPAHGSVTQVGDSTLKYNPAPNYNGSDGFSYVIRNPNNLNDTAQVSITVQPVNDPPIVAGIPNVSFMAGENHPLALDPYASDIDNNNSQLSWSALVLSAQSPGAATGQGETRPEASLENDPGDLQISIDPATHVATFHTDPGVTGVFTVEFTVSDPGGLSDTDTMTAYVGGPPVVVNPIANVSYPEDSGAHVVVSDLDSVFADPDGTPLSYSAASGNSDIPVTLNNNALSVSSTPNYFGNAAVTVTADDGNGSTVQDVFTVTITPVNDPPQIAPAIPAITFAEDGQFTLALNDHVGDIDNNLAQLSWSATVLTAQAPTMFALQSTSKHPGFHPAGIEVDTTDLTVSIDPATHIATISASGDSSGVFAVRFRVSDPGGLSDTQEVTVTVTAQGDPPLLVNPIANQNFPEDSGPHTVVSDLNSVFGDPDPGTVLSFSAGSDNPQIQASIQGNALLVSAAADYFGSATIDVSASDGGPQPASDQFTVTVDPVNDPPVIADLSAGFSVEEDDTLYIALDSLVSDIDDDIATLNWNVFLPGSGAGDSLFLELDSTTHLLAVIPAPDMTVSGREIQFTVTDPGDSSDTVLSWISITPVNDAPIFSDLPDSLGFAADSSVTLALWDYVSDPETADSLLTFFFEVSNSSLESSFDSTSGLLTLSAKPGFSGSASLGITVSDPQNAAVSDTIAVTVSPAVSIAEPAVAQQPLQYALEQNYPNPFNPETIIKFQLPAAGRVTLAVYNILGQKVRTLVNERREAGFYEAVWNGRDERGGQLASGIYIYHLRAGSYQQVRKMIFLK
ncbi:MAG: tandem-95 repeat protein [Calditrichae bacterium]|nr:tandem-95 repeat protein [Calditrichia bacterium]